MRTEHENFCELLVDNRIIFRKAFGVFSSMPEAGALIYTCEGRMAEYQRLKETYKILKHNEGIFSTFRGNMATVMTAKLSLQENPFEYYEAVKSISEQLHTSWLANVSYQVLAAIVIVERSEPEQYRHYVNKTLMIYQQMKKDHSFLTSDNDLVYAALLAVSNIDVDSLLLIVDECYRLLKKNRFGTTAQEISHILALDFGAPGLKIDKLIELQAMMKARKLNIGKGLDCEALAACSMLEMENEEIADELTDIYNYLHLQKEFKGIGVSKAERIAYSCMVLIKCCSPDNQYIDIILIYILLTHLIQAQAAAAAAA